MEEAELENNIFDHLFRTAFEKKNKQSMEEIKEDTNTNIQVSQLF